MTNEGVGRGGHSSCAGEAARHSSSASEPALHPSFLALDWGTTSLRVARLGADGAVLDERHLGEQGILHVPPGGFPQVFAQAVAPFAPAPGTLVLASGMVGSRQGWVEAPYCPCPAGLPDLAAHIAWVSGAPGGVRLGIVPGLSTREGGVPDVLRGEEVQVLGALALHGRRDATVVLPGTHSKWVRVQDGRIAGFATFMTGEAYGLLRRHSILARTLPADDGPLDEAAFLRGVAHARQAGSLLHGAFSARTLALFGELPPEAGPSYLSGLVVGEELRAAPAAAEVLLVGADALTRRYALALHARGTQALAADPRAGWQGLASIARTLEP